jgi:hypothetical protein
VSEIIADYKQHVAGEREVVDWTRPDGIRYRDVPVLYLRQVTEDDYRAGHPNAPREPERCYFWEVSID